MEDAKLLTIEPKFSTLRNVGKFISAIGWLVFAAGIIGTIVGNKHVADDEIKFGVLIIASIFSIINGIITVAIGYLIPCFIAIEKNTRATLVVLSKYANLKANIEDNSDDMPA